MGHRGRNRVLDVSGQLLCTMRHDAYPNSRLTCQDMVCAPRMERRRAGRGGAGSWSPSLISPEIMHQSGHQRSVSSFHQHLYQYVDMAVRISSTECAFHQHL